MQANGLLLVENIIFIGGNKSSLDLMQRDASTAAGY